MEGNAMIWNGRDFDFKIIVLDDDPTGIQCANGVYVYTDWSEETIEEIFEDGMTVSFLLTNSRSFSKEYTQEVHRLIAERTAAIARRKNRRFLFFSRSDSTLRWNYPVESESLAKVLKEYNVIIDGEVICPCFVEGGRFTVDDVHYILEAGKRIPVSDSEFARDSTFSFKNSDLKRYIEEKYQGEFTVADCISVTQKELRSGQLEQITKKLMSVSDFRKIIVNAETYDDLRVFQICFLKALSQGKLFLYRGAASFIRLFLDNPFPPLLECDDLTDSENKNGGLIVVGSHVRKTTAQMEWIKKIKNINMLEFDNRLVLEPEKWNYEIQRIASETNLLLGAGKTVCIHTRREKLDVLGAGPEELLNISTQISEGLVEVVKLLTMQPRYLIAKGGITSSDIGTKACQEKKAWVPGQIEKGIPVWKLGPKSRMPGTPYIIFPGNVGDEDTLYQVIRKLEVHNDYN